MEKELSKKIKAPLGHIEPHASLLNIPGNDHLIYKMVTAENLLRSIDGNSLHFNRVDSYMDFPGADHNDGKQLPKDHHTNANIRFEKAPDFSAASYYDQSRSRTYACCFSLENSEFIWNNYATDSSIGKICIVFNFGKLRECLNKTFQSKNAALLFNENQCLQIFSLNYGIIKYVKWEMHQTNKKRLTNPIIYTYMKDTKFSDENELRISLSAPGIGKFVLNDDNLINYPKSFKFSFDFRKAHSNGIIQHLLYAPDCNYDYLKKELNKRHIESVEA